MDRRDYGARGVELSIHQVTKPEEIAPAIDAAKTSGAIALNVLASALLFNNRKIIFERVAAWRLPAIYQWPEIAEDEGLIGYGPRLVQIYRDLISRQVVKVLRGITPADIPVEQPTRFELVINLKAAQAIRHEVPAGLELRNETAATSSRSVSRRRSAAACLAKCPRGCSMPVTCGC